MNEATFRKVNEGMEAGQDDSGLLSFVCECGRLHCTRLIRLTRAEYEGIRKNPRRFAIVEGHEIPGEPKRSSNGTTWYLARREGRRSGGRDRRGHRPAPAPRLISDPRRSAAVPAA